jgi:uncharacterized membrane protein YfcA
MGVVLWMIIALALGALLGTMLHPGFPEIVLVAFVLAGIAYGIRSFNIRRRTRTASEGRQRGRPGD